MEKIYQLAGCKIQVEINEKIIRVHGNSALWNYLDENRIERLAFLLKEIKNDYRQHYGTQLNITVDSLMVEVMVHVYCDYLGLKFNRIVRIGWIQNLMNKLLERAEVVDCGERSVDGNRWLWDFLARYKRPIFKLMPEKLGADNLKKS